MPLVTVTGTKKIENEIAQLLFVFEIYDNFWNNLNAFMHVKCSIKKTSEFWNFSSLEIC
jgi:hypothetical protein